ncbi:MAG: hypothetical protein PHI68_01400 [Candidatus Cloacimonetes bacterium]|nr:hypothetical protein [Candidatus Cloacimonadota bacterium]
MKRVCFAVLFLATLLIMGCGSMATQTKQYKDLDVFLANRNIDGLITQIEAQKGKAYKEKDMVLYNLDLGMLYRYKGDYVKSTAHLDEAERLMEEFYTKSLSKGAASLLLNDNALDYFGEDYEDIYTNVFKAMNYLQRTSLDSAFVELRRVNDKLSFLEDKHQKIKQEYSKSDDKKLEFEVGSNQFSNSALGRYLSMLAYKAEGKPYDANVDYKKIEEAYKIQPEIYKNKMPEIRDPLQKDLGPTLNVVALVGKSPQKKARQVHIKTLANQIVIVYVDKSVEDRTISWPGINPNLYFKFALPYIVNEESPVGKVRAIIDDGAQTVELNKIEDIGDVAVHTFKIKEPLIYTKSITRSVVKGVAAAIAKQKVDDEVSNPIAAAAAKIAIDAGVAATENADLRTSRFFPNDVLVAEIPLPEGDHKVKLEFVSKDGVTTLYSEEYPAVKVTPKNLSLVESWYIQ